jgi:hypothetical protein
MMQEQSVFHDSYRQVLNDIVELLFTKNNKYILYIMLSSFTIIIMFFIFGIILIIINLENSKFYYNDILFKIKSTWHTLFNSLQNNNLLDKPIEKVNKIAIVTFENRKGDEYIDLHNKSIKSYCEKWNYDYLFYDTCVHNVYWCKMHYVLDALKTGKYDYVVWLDSDTIIKNPNISMDLVVNKYSSDILVSADGGVAAFCAGVFIIKNSSIGISYIEDCINSQQKDCSIKSENKLKGFWAGLCYEQGIMNMLIFDKYFKYTTCLPPHIIYNGYINETNKICDIDTFILHLYVSNSDLRAKCFRRFT